MAKKGALLHYWNVHSQTALSLLSQLQPLRKRYLFSHVPQPSDFSMPGAQKGNGSFSTCCSRNFVLHLYRAAWPQIWDHETKISLGQSSQCKGVTPGQALRNLLSLQPVPLFPHHWGQGHRQRDRKALGYLTLSFCGNFVCFLSSENQE